MVLAQGTPQDSNEFVSYHMGIWVQSNLHITQKFFPKISQKTLCSSPVRASYGVMFVGTVSQLWNMQYHIYGLKQEMHNSSALAMELRLSRTNPLTYIYIYKRQCYQEVWLYLLQHAEVTNMTKWHYLTPQPQKQSQVSAQNGFVTIYKYPFLTTLRKMKWLLMKHRQLISRIQHKTKNILWHCYTIPS